MCMNCFTEDYKHIGSKVMEALERGGLFDEEIEASDEQWFDDPEWIELNRGEPFEVAWDAITKAPWIVDGTNYSTGKPTTVDGPLYSGGDKWDEPRYWTDDFQAALAYALFGSAIPVEGLDDTFREQVPMRETIPSIRVAKDPGYKWQVQEPGKRFGMMRDAEELWEEGDDLQNYILQEDPMSEAYMHDEHWGEPINEKMSDDEMERSLREILDKKGDNISFGTLGGHGTTGDYKTTEQRYAHIQGALDRLMTNERGNIYLDDEHKKLSQTSETDDISELDDEEYLREWGRWNE